MDARDRSDHLEQRGADQSVGEQDDLSASLSSLSRLGLGRLPLEALLGRVGQLAVLAIPGADGAGLTLVEEGRNVQVTATAPFVAEIEDVQYSLGEGPCITAAAEARTTVSGSLGGDLRWPRFGGRVARMAVHSVVSLPLLTPDGVVGAMNVYARHKEAFDGHAVELGELFAVPAAIAVQNAQTLEQTRRLAARLEAVLGTRMVVERAVGILMSRTGVSEQEALSRLRSLSQREHRKVEAVAHDLVDEAVRRARHQRR